MPHIPFVAMVRKDLQLFFSDRRSVIVSFVVPIAPGGFGVYHGVAVVALSLFGVPAEPAHVKELTALTKKGFAGFVKKFP